MKKLICILLTTSLLMSVLMSVMVFSASADIVQTGYIYEDYSEAPTEAPTDYEPEPTCEPEPEPTEADLPDPTESKPDDGTVYDYPFHYRELDNGTWELIGYVNNDDKRTNLIIPSEYDRKAVTRIAKNAFENNRYIISLTISENISSIGAGAFSNCPNLKEINYNATNCNWIGTFETYQGSVSVTSAFENCSSVNTIHFGDNVETIPDFAFWGVRNLNEITIPEQITKIGGDIFGNASVGKLTYNAVNCISAGYQWSEVEHIWEPEYSHYETVNYYRGAFYDLKAQSVMITDIVKSLPDNLFESSGVVSVDISAELTSIGGFGNCMTLKEIHLPQTITEIKPKAFFCCGKLSSINLPSGIKTVGKDAFYDTAWLESQPSGAVYINNTLYTYKDTTEDEDVVIREGTTDILDGAFHDANHIRSIFIPGSVMRIDNYTFSGKSIQSVILGEGMTEIGTGAFELCRSLETIQLPDSITLIEQFAFADCESLKKVSLPKKLNNLGRDAFARCSSLNRISLECEITTIEGGTFFGCSSIETVAIGDEVKTIGSSAFSGCTSLKDIHIPVGVLSIDNDAFKDCGSLEKILVPNSVTSIGSFTFGNCSSLKTAIIGDGVKTIGYGAFSGCSSLETVNIPNGLKELPSQYKGYTWDRVSYNKFTGIFENCTNLKTITIPDSVTFIGAFTFRNCTSLKRASIGKGVDDIGCGAFIGCTSLETVNIPEGITELPSRYKIYNWDNDLYAGIFENCTSLESIILPDSVKKIDNNTFLSCTNLNKVQIDGSVAEIGDNAFYKTAMTSITIKNPNAVLGYKAFGVKNTVYGDAPNEDFIVYGYKGSTAEQYAKEYQLQFNELSIVKHLGDVDGDSNIEVRDATWIQRHIAEVEMPFVINKTTADVDGDGIITVMDATAIQYYLANMKTTYKIGEKIE